MLRKFKISIDGKEYLVEMEEIGGVPQPAPVAPQPTAPVATTETPAPAVEEAPAPAARRRQTACRCPATGTSC